MFIYTDATSKHKGFLNPFVNMLHVFVHPTFFFAMVFMAMEFAIGISVSMHRFCLTTVELAWTDLFFQPTNGLAFGSNLRYC